MEDRTTNTGNEYEDEIHPTGRALTSDWSAVSFYNGCLEEFFGVQSDFSVQNTTKIFYHRSCKTTYGPGLSHPGGG